MPNSKFRVTGHCSEGYEAVKAHFEKLLRKGCEDNAQLCVYVGKECVLDLAGTAIGDDKYNADTLQHVFSSGKSVAAILTALQVDKGLLDYNAKVAQYWPEFAQEGKEDILLSDILRHQSGLAWFNNSIKSVEDAHTENIKTNAVGRIIEKEKPHYPGISGKAKVDTKREYHAFTRALLLNEIIRRVDPQGRTMGEILQQDIGIDGLKLGLKTKEDFERTTNEACVTQGTIMTQGLLPLWLGRRTEFNILQMYKMGKDFESVTSKMVGRPALFADMGDYDFSILNKPLEKEEHRKAETCSHNLNASARGLAKLAAIMANKGAPIEEYGQRLMSQDTWNTMHAYPTREYDGNFVDTRTNFTQGGVNLYETDKDATPDDFSLNNNRNGFYGWHGYGGSVMQWEPELQIGFAFVPTKLHWYDLFNMRGAALQNAVKECVKAKKTA